MLHVSAAAPAAMATSRVLRCSAAAWWGSPASATAQNLLRRLVVLPYQLLRVANNSTIRHTISVHVPACMYG